MCVCVRAVCEMQHKKCGREGEAECCIGPSAQESGGFETSMVNSSVCVVGDCGQLGCRGEFGPRQS